MDNKERYIVHVDMDAFFASVEELDNPSLKGKPVIVGSDPKAGKGRGVVAASSYAARKYGIHSAMPISIAYKKCPQAVFLPVNMERYSEISERVLEILGTFTPDIEPISIDEAFMDITGSWHLFGSPEETCRRIKTAIKKETGLTASVGMAPNKMTAKIASDIKKPDGLVIVTGKGLKSFLHALPVSKLWGVGEKTGKSLARMNIRTIGDLARAERKTLSLLFGKHGDHVWDLANGIDERPVERETEIKSVSNEHTFGEDTGDKTKIQDALMFLSEKVSRRLRLSGLEGRTITLKIRFSDFRTYTKAMTTDTPTNFADVLYSNSLSKVQEFSFWDNGGEKIRLLGIKVSNFGAAPTEPDLFPNNPVYGSRKKDLYRAIDKIKDKFGDDKVRLRRV